MLFKAQLHKQIKESYKFGIDDLLKFINDSSVNTNKDDKTSKVVKLVSSSTVKKKKKNKNTKKDLSRKNSDNLVIEDFLVNLKMNSIPKEKIVKIKTNLTKNWGDEFIKNYIFCVINFYIR